MTGLSKEILEKYQVRKSRKQKREFQKLLESFAEEYGYEMKIEKGSLGAENIVFGNTETAKVIYTAHYDTCAVMPLPNFITPKNQLFYWLYQFVLVFLIFAVAFAASSITTFLFEEQTGAAVSLVTVYLLLGLMMFGPANKHTANDNTSGVITVLELMAEMPPESREKAAFVLFDFEETGLIGSASFQSKHKKQLNDKLIFNFDCVSDGKNILLAVKKKAKDLVPTFEKAFQNDSNFTVHILTKGVFYPSDQANFRLGVGVAALKKSKHGILYMDKIHTKKDTVFEEENIEFLKNASLRLTELI